MARLLVINRVPEAAHFPRAAISAALSRAERAWSGRTAGRTVAVALVPKAESQRLNRVYRGRNKATNVLSFAAPARGELGDIIICYEVAKDEARCSGLKINDRIEYLFVHGLLHLLGFNHQARRQARAWARAEEKLLTIKAK